MIKRNRQIQRPNQEIILADSITHVVHPRDSGKVVICGSHGGYSAAVLALQRLIKGVIFNDAGGGKEKAGIAGLGILNQHGVPAAAVDACTARIGIAEETKNGIVTYANALAQSAGVRIGSIAEDAAQIMASADTPSMRSFDGNMKVEEKMTVVYTHPAGRRIVAMDSNSMVTEDNQMDIIMTGSHGGRVGSLPAVKYHVAAAFYNDAGVGKENAGISRLTWLEENNIYGAAVDANTARIGIGLETYNSGIVSHVNALAESVGIRPGIRAAEAARIILRCLEKKSKEFRSRKSEYRR